MISAKKAVHSLAAAAATAFAVFMAGSSVSAAVFDYEYDMSKSRWTYGGGYSFVTYTRLDGERKDRHGLDPTWITEDSEIIISYQTEGDYDGCPASLIFQTWTGDLVDSEVEQTTSITPVSYTDTEAVYTYDSFMQEWGLDTKYIYSISVSDVGTNKLFVDSMMITNLDIPDDKVGSIQGAVLSRDGAEIDLSLYTSTVAAASSEQSESVSESLGSTETVTETSTVSESVENTVSGDITESTVSEDAAESETQASFSYKTERVEEPEHENNILVIGIIIAVLAAAIVVAVILINKKNSSWH